MLWTSDVILPVQLAVRQSSETEAGVGVLLTVAFIRIEVGESTGESQKLPGIEVLGERIDGKRSIWRVLAGRFFRSWTASSLSGKWTPLASTEGTPFAGANNVKFSGNAWTKSISHGELIRSGTDQNLVVNPCKLRYFYQGLDPSKANGNYDTQPWKLGLLTQTNSAC